MKIREITNYLEQLAPLSSQESYDNSGLIVGNANDEVTKALVSLDCIESTIDEAIDKGCNLIIAHHPIVFKGLRKLNGTDYVQRTVLKAIKNDIAIYAIHTNFDNYRFGVNAEIGRRLGLNNLQILSPKENVLNKLAVFVPVVHKEKVKEALFNAGAGDIGDYQECSFEVSGTGTFKPTADAAPFEGESGKRSTVPEVRMEVLVSSHLLRSVISSMKSAHPYEEVAYEVYTIQNENQFEGAGMIGELAEPLKEEEMLKLIKTTFNCGVIRHTNLRDKEIKTVAFCGGSGSFLLKKAMQQKADMYITADYKYHEFFDADNRIIIADIGHYESEQYTSDLLADILMKKFPTFAVHLTEVNTNPINYF